MANGTKNHLNLNVRQWFAIMHEKHVSISHLNEHITNISVIWGGEQKSPCTYCKIHNEVISSYHVLVISVNYFTFLLPFFSLFKSVTIEKQPYTFPRKKYEILSFFFYTITMYTFKSSRVFFFKIIFIFY